MNRWPTVQFSGGTRKTVTWYFDNTGWTARVMSGDYLKWIDANYVKR